MIYEENDNIQHNNNSANTKTAHFAFGQNYKKIISTSKASFDFRKFLQKTTAQRRMAMNAHIQNKDEKSSNVNTNSSRAPLQDVPDNFTHSTFLHNKAFKIRCYSKKPAIGVKENQGEANQEQRTKTVSHLQKSQQYLKSQKVEGKTEKIDKAKTATYLSNKLKNKQPQSVNQLKNIVLKNNPNTQQIKLEKYPNFSYLQPISNNIMILYSSEAHTRRQCAAKKKDSSAKQKRAQLSSPFLMSVIFDVDYLVLKMKSSLTKGALEKEKQFYLKKLVIILKNLLISKTNTSSMSADSQSIIRQKIQIIFKARSQEQAIVLNNQFESNKFYQFHSIFSTNRKNGYQRVSVLNLSKIKDLSSNIVFVDESSQFENTVPILDSTLTSSTTSTTKIGFISFSQKLSNFVNSLQSLFNSLLLLVVGNNAKGNKTKQQSCTESQTTQNTHPLPQQQIQPLSQPQPQLLSETIPSPLPSLQLFDKISLNKAPFNRVSLIQTKTLSFPIKQLQERLKQRLVYKTYKRQTKSRRNRCQSSYQRVGIGSNAIISGNANVVGNVNRPQLMAPTTTTTASITNYHNSSTSNHQNQHQHQHQHQQQHQQSPHCYANNQNVRSLQIFKQKILKYLKIVKAQRQDSMKFKKMKKYGNGIVAENSCSNIGGHNSSVSAVSASTTTATGDFDCCLTRDKSSCKTNYQIVSELLRLNGQIHKQISKYENQLEIKQYTKDYHSHLSQHNQQAQKFKSPGSFSVANQQDYDQEQQQQQQQQQKYKQQQRSFPLKTLSTIDRDQPDADQNKIKKFVDSTKFKIQFFQ